MPRYKYFVMNPELDAYSFSGDSAREHYEEYKKYHLSETSHQYGYKLVRFRVEKTGYKVGFKFFYRNWAEMFMLKPDFGNRWGHFYFFWLIFFITIEPVCSDIFDRVEKDHLKEFEDEKK